MAEIVVTPTRKSYTLAFKLEVLSTLDDLDDNVSKTARQHNIAREHVIRWRRQQPELTESRKTATAGSTRKRRRIRKHKARFPELEQKLVEYVRDIRAKGLAVHVEVIRHKARELFPECYPALDATQFKASTGWATKFMKRNGLAHRRVTSVGQKVPENADELARRYLGEVSKKLEGITVLGNMDETPVWFDIPSASTIDFKGVKTVKSRTCGKEKLRFTATLTVLSTGHFLPTLVIFRGLKKAPKGKFPKDIIVSASKGGVMTGDFFTNQYIPNVWKKRPNSLFRPRSLLVMDTARCHMTEDVKASLTKENTDVQYIPGGMTPILQPLDTHLNKPFKDAMRKKWEEWMLGGEQHFTKSGNRKSASYELVCAWVSEVTKSMEKALVKRCFLDNGLTLDPAPTAYHSRLQKLLDTGDIPDVSQDSDSDDPFMDSESSSASSSSSSSSSDVSPVAKRARPNFKFELPKELVSRGSDTSDFEGFAPLD